MATSTETPSGASPRSDGPGSAELVIVANRLPVQLHTGPEGTEWRPSPGGLVSALVSSLRNRRGRWIGWAGTERHPPPPPYAGIDLESVAISRQEYEDYYLGFSNATLWPLYHDAIRAPQFHRVWWQSYVAVNERYARAAARDVAPGGVVWVQDYQLQLVPQMVRALRPDARIGFFLHIPFPPAELFMQLPWRREILNGILGADVVGFQVSQAASNFSRLARRLQLASGTDSVLRVDGRTVTVGVFPISVDFEEIHRIVHDPATIERAAEIRHELRDPEVILLGVDRLDYTKGIQQRVKAVAELFDDRSLKAGQHVMIQVAVPSRETDAHYERERHELEQAVSELNGAHGLVGTPVIHYLFQSLPFAELVALYLAADVMLVTPYRDGMNLVAKEYVAAREDLTGRLVLSEFAGAVAEMRGAFIVNPHDLEEMKSAIRQAIATGDAEARERMARMRRKITRRSVYDWADTFLAAVGGTRD